MVLESGELDTIFEEVGVTCFTALYLSLIKTV